MTTKNKVPEKLVISINHLADQIKHTESVNRYLIAKEEFTQDATAQKIMGDLSTFQKEIRQKQNNNEITPQDLEKLRSLQTNAQENEVIYSYSLSQQVAIGKLREINAEISNLLGIDFASLAKNTCC